MAKLTLVFREKHEEDVKTLEVAGEDGGTGGYFTSSNFLLNELVVGRDGAPDDYERVKLELTDLEDNQADKDEALYVNTLTIDPGGTFDFGEDDLPIYYLRTGEETEDSARRLYMGDANLDGCVDGLDYVIWSMNYDPEEDGKVWSQADFNGDRIVDGLDYIIWSDNYGKGCGRGGSGKVKELLAKCKDGDFDGDGDIDSDDADLLLKLEGE